MKDERIIFEERGVILLLVAVLAFVFAAFLALVIDNSQISSSQHKQHKTAELAALAALTGYQSATVTATTPGAQYLERLTAAVDRAEQVVGMEGNNLRLGTSGTQLDSSIHELQETSGALTRSTTGDAGTITPGLWFFDEPTGGCGSHSDTASACPCPSGVWQRPCFRPNTSASVGLTAFEVRLKSKSASPIRYVFGRVMGAENIAINSRGRASVRPRMSITGIDLSLSITGEDNIDWDGLPPGDPNSNFDDSSAYVYPLDENDVNSHCFSQTNHKNPCLLDPGPSVPVCKFLADAHFSPMWYKLSHDRYATSAYYPRTRHFRNDYSCWIVEGRHFLIDTSIHPYDADGNPATSEGTYYGPEPFMSILSSFGQALAEVEKRTVPGDQISLFGFDQDADLNGPRYIGPAQPNSPLWQELKDLTNVKSISDFRGDSAVAVPDENLRKRIEDHAFFPRPPNSFTDLAGALLTASRTVDNSAMGNDGSIDITLLTDGLANVRHWDLAFRNSQGEWDMGTDRLSGCTAQDRYLTYSDSCWFPQNEATYDAINLVTWDDRFWIGNSVCWWNYKQGGLKNEGWVPLAKRGFRINVGLFSKDVQPHILLKRSLSDPTKCMDDKDARKSWRNLMQSYDDDDNGYQTSSCYTILGAPDACPYTAIGDMLYRGFVKSTGGVFVPVRPPCNTDKINAKLPWGLSQASCEAGALQEKLDSELCAKYTKTFEQYGHVYDFTVAYQEDLQPTFNALMAAGAADNSVLGIAEDGKGEVTSRSGDYPAGAARMICDTTCRTPEQQLRDMYKTIFESNPYVLVRDDYT